MEKEIPEGFIIFFSSGEWGYAPNRKELKEAIFTVADRKLELFESAIRGRHSTVKELTELSSKTRVVNLSKIESAEVDLLQRQEEISEYVSICTEVSGNIIKFSCRLRRLKGK